jgi:hypothetical protein
LYELGVKLTGPVSSCNLDSCKSNVPGYTRETQSSVSWYSFINIDFFIGICNLSLPWTWLNVLKFGCVNPFSSKATFLSFTGRTPKRHFCRFWQTLIKECYMQKHNSNHNGLNTFVTCFPSTCIWRYKTIHFPLFFQTTKFEISVTCFSMTLPIKKKKKRKEKKMKTKYERMKK